MKAHTVEFAKNCMELEMKLDNGANKGRDIISIVPYDGGFCIVSNKETRSYSHALNTDDHIDDPWMLTRCGNEVSFQYPQARDISIDDIAVSLSRKARFNGHTLGPVDQIYTVGQHSCLVHDKIAEEFPTCRTTRLWALLHDAAEAYLPDVHSQLKKQLPRLLDSESLIEDAIAKSQDLPPMPKSVIKHVDLRMLATERRDLMFQSSSSWGMLDDIDPYEMKIEVWSIKTTYTEFTRRYRDCMEL